MKKVIIDNPRYPHRIRIIRKEVTDEHINPFKENDVQEVVLYDGDGRSFTDTTTTGDKKVDTNKRKASIPVRFDEWGKDEEGDVTRYVPMSGDVLEAWKGKWHEVGTVRDAESDNNRTIVYWNVVRN